VLPNPDGASASPFDDGDLYDAIFHDFSYGTDFYVGLAREARGPVLEIACGTGRILLPCLQAGVDVDGLDLFEPMLGRLRRKATALGLSPSLYRADMSDFSLPHRYALIIIPFNAFVHNLTQEAQIGCLERCREHLLPAGLLAFDTFFPALGIIGAPEGTREMEMETRHPETGQLLRLYDTRTFDRVKQVQHSVNEVEAIGADGGVETLQRSEFCVRWVYREEMALLLRVAGFSAWEIYGGFDRRPLTQETDAMVVMARGAGEE
jgi:SAM-dependent methyltransferase